MTRTTSAAGLFLLLVATAYPAAATDDEFHLVLQDHVFHPQELTVPAGRKVRLVIENRDSTAEEFDSYALNREKVIPGNSTGFVYIGPLAPGRYAFMGEYHAGTATGAVLVK
jgi:plastocyanin